MITGLEGSKKPGGSAQSALAPGAGVREYEEAHNLIQRESLDAAIDLALARQGIDPQKVPKRVYDIIRRLNIKLNEINIKAQNDISRIQQAAGLEYNGTILELNQACLSLKIEQGVVPEPPISGDQSVKGMVEENHIVVQSPVEGETGV